MSWRPPIFYFWVHGLKHFYTATILWIISYWIFLWISCDKNINWVIKAGSILSAVAPLTQINRCSVNSTNAAFASFFFSSLSTQSYYTTGGGTNFHRLTFTRFHNIPSGNGTIITNDIHQWHDRLSLSKANRESFVWIGKSTGSRPTHYKLGQISPPPPSCSAPCSRPFTIFMWKLCGKKFFSSSIFSFPLQ